MNRQEVNFPRLDPEPVEGMLPRKRFQNLQLEATVFQQATNLQPPLDPPQPPMNPNQPSTEEIIGQYCYYKKAMRKRRCEYFELPPPTEVQNNATKDRAPETQVC